MYPNETRVHIAILGGIAVLLILVVVLISTIVTYHRRKWAFHLENIGHQIICLDAERERIAIDLHDDLGTSLSGLKLRLQCIKPADAETIAILDFSKSQIDGIMHRLRVIAFNMIPDVLQRRGLEQALQELLNIITLSTGIVVYYEYNAPAFEHKKATHMYRMVQEILNNTIKHADASAINLRINKIKDIIQLHYADNGKGFNKNFVIREGNGFGLKNIRSRADLLQAKIYITTSPAKGVDYIIEIPADDPEKNKSDCC